MPYDKQTDYQKFQSCEEGVKPEECSCCPPGLVAIYDDCGHHTGCLSPNDASIFNNSQETCAEGYIKLYHPVSNEYLGCVATSEYLAIITGLTPVV